VNSLDLRCIRRRSIVAKGTPRALGCGSGRNISALGQHHKLYAKLLSFIDCRWRQTTCFCSHTSLRSIQRAEKLPFWEVQQDYHSEKRNQLCTWVSPQFFGEASSSYSHPFGDLTLRHRQGSHQCRSDLVVGVRVRNCC